MSDIEVTETVPLLVITPTEVHVSVTPPAEVRVVVQPVASPDLIVLNAGKEEVVIVTNGVQGPIGITGSVASVSTAANNQIQVVTDGLYVPEASAQDYGGTDPVLLYQLAKG